MHQSPFKAFFHCHCNHDMHVPTAQAQRHLFMHVQGMNASCSRNGYYWLACSSCTLLSCAQRICSYVSFGSFAPSLPLSSSFIGFEESLHQKLCISRGLKPTMSDTIKVCIIPGEAAGCPDCHIFRSLETTNVDAIFNILVLNQIILDLTNFI